MIRKIKYEDIDFEKYKRCLRSSPQKNLYATPEILDELCERWEILADGDYEQVMPVPLKRKWGFTFVLMPLFCQQLGIFGQTDPEKNQQFLSYLRKNYHVYSYAFNAHNCFLEQIETKKNFIIPPQDYCALRKNYFKGRKSTVKTAQYLHIKKVQRHSVVGFINNNFKGLDKKSDVAKFLDYLMFLEEKQMLKIYGSFNEHQLTSITVLIDSGERLSLLALINDPVYRNDNGASFLIDRILQENIAAKKFDFMGGNIPTIARFFKSFGSQLQQYPVVELTKRDLLRNFFSG